MGYENLGPLARLDATLASSKLEGFLKNSQKSGCSWFFIASAVISLVSGAKTRQNAFAQLQEDEAFQQRLQEAKEKYKDEKDADERAFRTLLKQMQREFHKEEAIERIQNDLDKMELQLFFKDWPLKTSIKAINDLRKTQSIDNCPLNIIIGKHTIYSPNNNSILSYESQYCDIVDRVINEIKSIGVEATNVYRFCEKNSITGGPAIAYIYAMMSALPCVVIMPKANHLDKTLSVNVSLWTQDSIFPYHRSLFTIEYDENKAIDSKEYFLKKKNELISHYTTICGVFNDIHMLIERQVKPHFCRYSEKDSLFADFPQLRAFAIKEYSALISDINNEQSTRVDIMTEIMGRKEAEFIQGAIKEVLNEIK
ncbi:MAG: hypothetical protein IJB05_03965 [Bacteroidales bacterium]|nr:hypothetical protein [Bacteroidales bacterium]